MAVAAQRQLVVREVGRRGQRAYDEHLLGLRARLFGRGVAAALALWASLSLTVVALGYTLGDGLRAAPLIALGVALSTLCARWLLHARAASAADLDVASRPGRFWPRLAIVDPAVTASPEGGSRVEGRVRARRERTSPVRGEACVAARVRGATDGGEIDDGVCGDFDVVDDAGQIIARFEGGSATVDLDVDAATAAPTRPDGALREFLGARVELGTQDEATVTEALLRVGDRVTLEGVSDDEVQPSGYRGTAPCKVFRGTPERPVRVRGEPAERVRLVEPTALSAAPAQADERSIEVEAASRRARAE